MYWTDLRQILRIDTHIGGYDQSGLRFPIAQGTLQWKPILGRIGEPNFIRCAGIQQGMGGSKRIHALTPTMTTLCLKKWVNFGPETLEFCWRVCAQVELYNCTICDAYRFNHIRQMVPIVDADAGPGGLTLGFATHLVVY